MRSRIYHTKQFLDEGKGKIVFVKTEAMWADRATKPFLQPGKCTAYASFVLGETNNKSTGGRCNFNLTT
jgi:hypothetical protein